MLTTIIIICLICSCVACSIYNRMLGFFLGLLFGPIGIIMAAILALDPDYIAERKCAYIRRKNEQSNDPAVFEAFGEQHMYQAGIDARTKKHQSVIQHKENKDLSSHWQKLKKSGKAW